MKIRSLSLSLPVAVAVLCLPSLDGFLSATAIAAAQPKENDALRSLFKAELPANAQEITAARKTVKAGDTVTIRGYIPTAKDAFSADAAVFSLVESMPQAVKTEKKDATAPAEMPIENKATIKLVDAKGSSITGNLAGKFGLKAGAEVFVTGKVESVNGKEAMVLTAISLHVPRSPLPAGFFAEKAPANAKDVSEARKSGGLKVGDEVTLRGRIGGSKEPFVAGRAVFTLMGRGLKACNENPDDNCATPWDYCCETKAGITANSATVQVVDDKGQVLRTDLKGRRGLKELSEVVVTGKVAAVDGKGLVVNATSLSGVQ